MQHSLVPRSMASKPWVIDPGCVVEAMGEEFLVLCPGSSVVYRMTGFAAEVVGRLQPSGAVLPQYLDTAVYELAAVGVVTPAVESLNALGSDSGGPDLSRRQLLHGAVAAGVVGITVLALPAAAVAASVFGAPTGVSASAGVGSATVSWLAVPTASSYQVYLKKTLDADYVTFGGPVTDLSVLVTGLDNATSYDFHVTASKTAGGETITSSPSDKASVTTPSADLGVTWDAVDATEANLWQSVAYGNGVFVAVSFDGNNRVMRSTDGGRSWNQTGITGVPEGGWNSVAYGNGVWIAVASFGSLRVLRSTDNGLTWVAGPAATGPNGWTAVATDGNGVWMAVSESGDARLMRSTDNGLTWFSRATALAASTVWRSVAYGNGVWIAVASSTTQRVMRSTDGGDTWSRFASPEDFQWTSVAYGNGVWVAVAKDGITNDGITIQVMRSTDGGLNWSLAAAAGGNQWESVAYGNGVWVAVSIPGGAVKVMRSVNGGQSWADVTPASPAWWNSVAYGDGSFVSVGSNNNDNNLGLTIVSPASVG